MNRDTISEHPTKIVTSSLWEQLVKFEEGSKNVELPFISIVIPTINAAHSIVLTLDSVLNQDYPSYEVIIVDNSTDNTLEIIKGYKSDKIRIYSVTNCMRYEMLNKGLSQATGIYINFLFPGDFYIFHQTLKYMMIMAAYNEKPHLLYCGTLLRDEKQDAKILFRELSIKLLQRGQQPTSLQSCWFQTTVIRELGKFNPSYHLRGGFELLCRFYLKKEYRFMPVNRVLTDYDLRAVTSQMVRLHFWETMKTVYHYFGLTTMLKWLFFYQKDCRRLFKLWIHSFKIAFSGR